MLCVAACVLPVAHLLSPNHLSVLHWEYLRSVTFGCGDDVIVHYSPNRPHTSSKLTLIFLLTGPSYWDCRKRRSFLFKGRPKWQTDTLLHGIERRPKGGKRKISPVYCWESTQVAVRACLCANPLGKWPRHAESILFVRGCFTAISTLLRIISLAVLVISEHLCANK